MYDKNKKEELIHFFEQNNNILRFSDIIRNGFHRDQINDLLGADEIEKIAHGLYRIKGYDPDNHINIVYASFQSSMGVICLISALAFHEITDIIPARVNIAIPRGMTARKIRYPAVRFFHYSKETWESGVEEFTESGHKFKVYNVAKTIADCFKFRNKIGISVARTAMKTALQEKKTTVNEIMEYSRICRVDKIVRQTLEVMYS